MAETTPKKPRVDVKVPVEEKKVPESSEKETVFSRYIATRRLIKVNTTPPTYLNTLILPDSPVLTTMAYLNLKEETFEKNEFGDRIMVCLPDEGIHRNVWVLLNAIIESVPISTETLTGIVNHTTLDHLFYICHKNDIPLHRIWGDEKKLMVVIVFICTKNLKQHFPNTINITGVNEYYKAIGNTCLEQMKQHDTENKKSYLASLECIPPLHHIVTSEIVSRVWKAYPHSFTL